MIPFKLSNNLSHTWFFDLDGTILEHRVRVDGVLTGENKLLPGVKELWNEIPADDIIILITARWEEDKQEIIDFFNKNNLRFDHLLVNMAKGERIVVNDIKPDQGLDTAIGWNVIRNKGFPQ